MDFGQYGVKVNYTKMRKYNSFFKKEKTGKLFEES